MIDYPADRIDLAQWLSTMSDRDHQACSRGHRAAGTFREGGTFGMVNVESKAGADHVFMHSTSTRVYVLHIFPATIEVIWTLGVEPKTVKARRSVARLRRACRRRWDSLPLFLGWHVQEETIGFAADIARKVSGGFAS